MAKEWYLMKPTTLGGFENAEFDGWHTTFETDILTSFAATDVLIYGDRMTNEPREIRAVVQASTEDSYNQMKVRQILCSIGNIVCGDLLFIEDRWWIVISLVDNNGVYEKAILYYCNVMLNLTSPITLETVTYPVCVHNATQYNSGERERDYMRITSSQRLIYFPCNEETVVLDNDYRFMIDRNLRAPSVWKVAQADTENDAWDGHGIMRIMAVEDETGPDDNAELMLADNTKWLSEKGFSENKNPGGGWVMEY